MICWLVSWFLFALVVGLVAKAIHPGQDPVGLVFTLAVGVAGSYVGGLLNFLLFDGDFLAPSGIIMSIVGAVLCCAGYTAYVKYRETQKND